MRNLLFAAVFFYGSLTLWMYRELQPPLVPSQTLGESLLADLREEAFSRQLSAVSQRPGRDDSR